MEQRPGDRSRRDLDNFLVNGYFKSSRSQNTPSLPSRPSAPPTVESTTWRESARPAETTRGSKQSRRAVRSWPPRPCVEDEMDSLAREHLAAATKAAHLKHHEPPFRGTVDQQPIILESEISKADASKLHNDLNREAKAEYSGERRFVLIPRHDTHSPIREDQIPRRSSAEPLSPSLSRNGVGERSPGNLDAGPPLGRRRSRQDLPSLQTEMPPYRRSTSAYAYTPTSKQAMPARGPAPDALLSPDRATAPPLSKGYFDIPANANARQPHASTPVAENRRSGGTPASRPATPMLEKRNSAGLDVYGRTRQDGEKAPRPQRSAEGGAYRTDRTPSTHAYLDPPENPRHRKSSSQSSRRHYSSTDESDSGSDGRRRRHRHHHQRKNGHTTLHPDSDREHHSRAGSAKPYDGKPASRYNSPLVTPDISPSQLPPIDRADTRRPVNPGVGRESGRPPSRPVSPLHPLTDSRKAGMLDAGKDFAQSRARSGQRSRQSSPEVDPRIRHAASMPSPTIPIPIPTRIDLQSHGDSRRPPRVPQFDEDLRPGARPSPSPKPSWPPPFQPSQNLDKPVGSFRRYSQDLDQGNIPTLPPCPRMATSRGHDDWLTLPRAPFFNICPSCYDSTVAPTEFHGHFVTAPPRPSGKDVLCDFGSQPWYRIAWLLTLKERRRDLNLMTSLANISATVPPCTGKEEAVRKWYSIVDPGTGYPIRNFDVCYRCVKSIETLLPALRGVFVRTDHNGPPGLPRVCDMRFDGKRFVHYFDALETAADSADDDYDPDIRDLVSLVKRFASIPECPRDQSLSNSYWYIITQLPEFTVCPECFEEAVLPGLEAGKAIPMMFNKSLQRLPLASCQLYSDRMREILEQSVQGNDYKGLAGKARERRGKEMEFKRAAERERGRGKAGEKEIRRIEADWASWE